jgi:hypothetical protein
MFCHLEATSKEWEREAEFLLNTEFSTTEKICFVASVLMKVIKMGRDQTLNIIILKCKMDMSLCTTKVY